jgi:hypothetical protein
LGNILGGLFRKALPMLKSGLAAFGKQALRTGMDIAGDMADGQGFRESANRRVREGIKRFIRPEADSMQTGSGRRKRVRRQKNRSIKRSNKRSIKRRKVDDIFH